MDPLPQERKEKKGWKVVTVLREVLLLKYCRGAAAEHEEDQNESHGTLHVPNTEGTRLEKQREPNKSLLKKALGLFTKWNRRRVQDSGRNVGAGPSSEGAPLRVDGCGPNDGAGPSSQRAPLQGDHSVQNDGSGPSSQRAPPQWYQSEWNDGAGPSSQRAPPRHMSTCSHESAFHWILPGVPDEAPTQSSAETSKKVTSAPALHEPRPGPSQHEDVQDSTVLFSVMDSVLEVKPGPSHLGDLQGCTITIPEKKSSSSSRELSDVPEEVRISIDDTSRPTDVITEFPTPSNCHLLCVTFSIVLFVFFLFIPGFLFPRRSGLSG